MEHLDLAGMDTTPNNWNLPAFDQQDAIYLSNSRQMLEPILEETSDDEEHSQNSWNQYENTISFYSSAESETGSVIRIEVHKDADSISERDFACPAKRARRSQDFQLNTLAATSTNTPASQSNLEDTVILRRYQRNENNISNNNNNDDNVFLAYEQPMRENFGHQNTTQISTQRHSTGSRRFEDFYSDSDSLSYNSLSRSSSLIQFESLERQMLLQDQHVSSNSLGASSPSLLSFDGSNNTKNMGASEECVRSGNNSANNSRRGSQSSLLRRFESSDGRLHQTYFDLDKLDFDDDDKNENKKSNTQIAFLAGAALKPTPIETTSDSEISTSSSIQSILPTKTKNEPTLCHDVTDAGMAGEVINSKKTCHSAENLSEDSGYSEPSSMTTIIKSSKSKNITQNFEKFSEEEEEFQHDEYLGGENEKTIWLTTEKINENLCKSAVEMVGNENVAYPKINDATFIIENDGDDDDDDDNNDDDDDDDAIGATKTTLAITKCTRSLYYGCGSDKNSSPIQEVYERSFAHSPSPSSSVGSDSSRSSERSVRSSISATDSASTRASAASFTWLPPVQLHKEHQHQRKLEGSCHNREEFSYSETTYEAFKNTQPQSSRELCTNYRNSLPDIRDVYGQETEKTNYFYDNGSELEEFSIHNKKIAETLNYETQIPKNPNSSSTINYTTSSITRLEAGREEGVATNTDVEGLEAGWGCSSSDSDSNSENRSRRTKTATATTTAELTSSVPNELDKLGRHPRCGIITTDKFNNHIKASTDEEFSSTEEAEKYDRFDNYCNNNRTVLRRACSWSDKHKDRATTDNTQGSGAGYMNASYQNLTLLDYSGQEPMMNENNLKRGVAQHRQSIGPDYESIICKGNFLLDELSQIYDRNASILNDRTVDSLIEDPSEKEKVFEEEIPCTSQINKYPLPPPRRNKSVNSSCSDLGEDSEGDVQHVQLTIRQAPERQRHKRNSEKTNSMLEVQQTLDEMKKTGSKTFDQDPTNLRTSYAQSLEKCNFDAKEISITDLRKVRAIPKRRFHSHAVMTKKKNLVSSTPNLNSFEANAEGDIDDDIYVSSAHTSMHQLPQSADGSGGTGHGGVTQKPLGILLPAGSRTSFGKEVSFCPVVSKYCWQEQSSEECNEPQLQRQDGQELQDDEPEQRNNVDDDDESDDELLNRNDETVIFNTKENEMIIARINEELLQREKEVENNLREQSAKQKELVYNNNKEIVDNEVQITTTTTNNDGKECETQFEKTNYLCTAAGTGNDGGGNGSGICKVSLKPTIVSVLPEEAHSAITTNTTKTIIEKATDNIISVSESAVKSKIIEKEDDSTAENLNLKNNNNNKNTRPLSIQLPILSEPPINRAHHILYASQQLLNNRASREFTNDDDYDDDDEIGSSQNSFGQQPHYTQLKATSVCNLQNLQQQQQQKANNMSSISSPQQQQQQQQQTKYNISNNNNNNSSETMKSKFKTDEKHPRSIGFLSRFANGLRFSLRRNKKKNQQIPAINNNNNNNSNDGSKKNKDNKNEVQNNNKKQKSPDFIYIPLKGPITHNNSIQRSGNTNITTTSSSNSSRIGAKLSSSSSPSPMVTTNNTTGTIEKVVTGKPPLPKQPPRIINTQPNYNNNKNNSYTNNSNNNQNNSSMLQQSASATHAHNMNNHQQMRFLEAERSYYYGNENSYGEEDYEQQEHDNSNLAAVDYSGFRNQLMAGMQANCHEAALASAAANVNAVGGLPAPTGGNALEFTSPSRATVAQKTQLFQNLATKNNSYNNNINSNNNKTTSNGRLVNSIKVQPLRKYSNNTNNSNNCQQNSHNGSKIGLIETNLDTHETIISGKTRSLLDIAADHRTSGNTRNRNIKRPLLTIGGYAQNNNEHDNDNNDDDDEFDVDVNGDVIKSTTTNNHGGMSQIASVRRPHKSMEFLLDKENQKNVLPPENELQKSHENNPTLSEHQLRIQASLQRLNIPDWFRQYNQKSPNSPDGGNSTPYKPGNFTRKRTTESGRWAGLNSKTTSLSSLGSQRSDRSPLLLSPSAHSHHGAGNAAGGTSSHHQPHTASSNVGTNYGASHGGAFSRWSTSHLNSSQTSPIASQRGSFARGAAVNSSFMSVASGNSGVIRNSFRQPYMGWRSQEKLSQRTAHERLASSLLAQQQQQQAQQQQPHQRPSTQRHGQVVTPEIQSSIKEVTSAIVHYVNDQTNPERSRSASPNSRKCWLESSFVGIRPLDSPQTPIIENSATTKSTVIAQTFESRSTVTSSPYFLNSNNFGITLGARESTLTSAPASGTSATNVEALRINGLSICEGPKRSLSTASLEDVLASLLGLPSGTSNSSGAGPSSSDAYARSTTGDTVNQPTFSTFRPMPQQLQQQHHHIPILTSSKQSQQKPQQQQLDINALLSAEQQQQQRLRRSSEGDKPNQQASAKPTLKQDKNSNVKQQDNDGTTTQRRISLGDSSESIAARSLTNPSTSAEQQQQQIVKCRYTKCDKSTNANDAKKYYKSCHNCTHLYCSRECRRAHWEKHRKACLHSRASNLCRQVLATCKDDPDSQRHLSRLARSGVLTQSRGVVRVLFRSAEAAEGFIKHGFQCMGEATYVRWPDLAPAEMGLELYAELLKLSMEYKIDSKMLIYVAICVVSEAPGTSQTPVRWERQLVSRCAKLKLCKGIVSELNEQLIPIPNAALVAVPEPATEILILTFNPAHSTSQRELILNNILGILLRRGVILRKHYPEIFQRLQSYADGQTDKFNAVTLHPRDTQSGQGFVCIIMPVHVDSELIRLPSVADGGNRVTTIDVGSPTALAQLTSADPDQVSGVS